MNPTKIKVIDFEYVINFRLILGNFLLIILSTIDTSCMTILKTREKKDNLVCRA